VERIAIIGLGLIGGSIAMGLKRAQLKDLEVVASDRSRDAESLAKKLGAVDRCFGDPRRAVAEAGLVVIATPVRAIREVMTEIAPHLAEGAVVTDTGSTKAEVLRWAAEILPPHVSFVGGHPMAGKETAGLGAAEAALFREKIYCLAPTVNAEERAVRTVIGLVQTLGATPWFIDPDEHDRYVAAISHMPILTSAALFSMARGSKAWNDLAPLASSGFKDVTRLASGDPTMAADIFATNREAVLHWLDRYIEELSAYRRLLANEETTEALHKQLQSVQDGRDEFVAGRGYDRGMPRPPVEVPSAAASLTSLLIPPWAAERMRDLDKNAAARAREMSEGVRRDLDRGNGRGHS
jgi:prephenate dehydrogenase